MAVARSRPGSTTASTSTSTAIPRATEPAAESEPPDASVSKVATQACVTFQITVNNPTLTNSLTLTALNDAPYGNIADATNPNLCSTDCDLDPAVVIAPGQSFTCEFAVRVADSSSNQTDTVTATMSAGGDTITRTASDTILVDLNP